MSVIIFTLCLASFNIAQLFFDVSSVAYSNNFSRESSLSLLDLYSLTN